MMPFVPWTAAGRTDDATLARHIALGDRTALDAVYRREAAAVYRYAYALCGNAGWAADAVQDAFMALAASNASGYDPARGSLGAWLAGVARHAVLAQWRAAHGHAPVDGDDLDGTGPSDADGDDALDTLMVRRQDVAALWAAIRSLPWPFREALVLVDLQERPYEQAAAIAGIPINTLRTRLHRARTRLAAVLNGATGVAA